MTDNKITDDNEQETDVDEQLKRIPGAKMEEAIRRDIEEIYITGLSSLGVPNPVQRGIDHSDLEEGLRTMVQEIEAKGYTWEWAAQVEALEDDIVDIFNPNDPREQSVISAWVWMIAKEEVSGDD